MFWMANLATFSAAMVLGTICGLLSRPGTGRWIVWGPVGATVAAFGGPIVWTDTYLKTHQLDMPLGPTGATLDSVFWGIPLDLAGFLLPYAARPMDHPPAKAMNAPTAY